jgi:hypothetical protein
MPIVPAALYQAIGAFIFIAVKQCSPVFQLKLSERHASYRETFKVLRKYFRSAKFINLLVGSENAEVRSTEYKDWHR